MKAKALVGCLGLALVFCVCATPAQASRTLLTKTAVHTDFCLNCTAPPPPPPFIPPTDGQIEGPCGLAVAPGGNLYVSDYYHRVIDVYSGGGGFISQIAGVAPSPEGPCGLAIDSKGALYADIWHQRVVRLQPSAQTFDTGDSTGVAVDAAGNVYVDDRTYVEVYDSSGAKVLQIGLGSLNDGFGVAVDPSGKRVYVPDAATDTVKVYEPAVKVAQPVKAIGPFNSLVDASLAVDPTNGHLLVVDNLKPGFEHPTSVVYEFDAAGAPLGALSGTPVHGEPSGIAVDSATGKLYVTDGNSELSNVYAYGPYTPPGPGEAPGPEPEAPSSEAFSPEGSALLASPQSGAGEEGERISPRPHRPGRRPHKRGRRDRARVGIAAAFAATPR